MWQLTYHPRLALPCPASAVDFSLHPQGWNLRNLDSLLSRTLEAKNKSLPGVNTPYLYFGMWRSTFAW